MSLDLPITRIQHTGLPVTDLAASKAFYAGLGFAEAMSSTFPHPEGTRHVCKMQRGDITAKYRTFDHQMENRLLVAGIHEKITDKWDYFDVKAELPKTQADIEAAFGTEAEIGCKMAAL